MQRSHSGMRTIHVCKQHAAATEHRMLKGSREFQTRERSPQGTAAGTASPRRRGSPAWRAPTNPMPATPRRRMTPAAPPATRVPCCLCSQRTGTKLFRVVGSSSRHRHAGLRLVPAMQVVRAAAVQGGQTAGRLPFWDWIVPKPCAEQCCPFQQLAASSPAGCRRPYREQAASSSTRHTCGGTRHAPSRHTMRSCCSPLSTCVATAAAATAEQAGVGRSPPRDCADPGPRSSHAQKASAEWWRLWQLAAVPPPRWHSRCPRDFPNISFKC